MTSLPPFPLKICHYDYGKQTALQTHLCCASLAKNAALCELSYPAALLPIAKSWKSLEKVLIAQLSWLIYISHLQRTELSGSPADMFPAKSAYPLLKIILPIPFPSSSNSSLVPSHRQF